jgi:hypothetical protein
MSMVLEEEELLMEILESKRALLMSIRYLMSKQNLFNQPNSEITTLMEAFQVANSQDDQTSLVLRSELLLKDLAQTLSKTLPIRS